MLREYSTRHALRRIGFRFAQLFDLMEQKLTGSSTQQKLDDLFRFDKVQELRCDEVPPRCPRLSRRALLALASRTFPPSVRSRMVATARCITGEICQQDDRENVRSYPLPCRAGTPARTANAVSTRQLVAVVR